MFKFFKKMSLIPKGLRYKTYIAFSLMSIIPLLTCMWLVTNFIFPNIDLFFGLSLGNISFVLFVSIVIAILGFRIIEEIVGPVIKIAGDAKDIAGGDLDRVVETKTEDEIGDLSSSLNIMTKKIKENIEELKLYGEKTRLINMEINKKVFALSSLLQIGNLISSQTELVPALNLIAQKICDIEEASAMVFLLLDKGSGELKIVSSYNVDETKIKDLSLNQEEITSKISVLDKNTRAKKGPLSRLALILNYHNAIMLPIMFGKKIEGALVVLNRAEDFVFTEDRQELLKLFTKQASIAVENDFLLRKSKELEVEDELTGLYNQNYIKTRLDEEIKRSILYQRPCGYILIDIDDSRELQSFYGEAKMDAFLKEAAGILRKTVSEVDKVGRIDADRFAIILPEKNKKQVANFAEEIRKKLEEGMKKVVKAPKKLTVSIGVSENPIDGTTSDELMKKAEELLKQAKSLGKNRVAV